MIRLIAFAALAFVVTTSVQAAPVAPINEPESLITQVVAGCGVGMTRINGLRVQTPQASSSQVCTMDWEHLREILLRDVRGRRRARCCCGLLLT